MNFSISNIAVLEKQHFFLINLLLEFLRTLIQFIVLVGTVYEFIMTNFNEGSPLYPYILLSVAIKKICSGDEVMLLALLKTVAASDYGDIYCTYSSSRKERCKKAPFTGEGGVKKW